MPVVPSLKMHFKSTLVQQPNYLVTLKALFCNAKDLTTHHNCLNVLLLGHLVSFSLIHQMMQSSLILTTCLPLISEHGLVFDVIWFYCQEMYSWQRHNIYIFDLCKMPTYGGKCYSGILTFTISSLKRSHAILYSNEAVFSQPTDLTLDRMTNKEYSHQIHFPVMVPIIFSMQLTKTLKQMKWNSDWAVNVGVY